VPAGMWAKRAFPAFRAGLGNQEDPPARESRRNLILIQSLEIDPYLTEKRY